MSAVDKLSPRQRACLRGVVNFQSYKEIARDLGISDSMVEKHLRLAREKLGVESTSEAARVFALEEGEAEPQAGIINLPPVGDDIDTEAVSLSVLRPEQLPRVGDTHTGAADPNPPLTAIQTLSRIGRFVLGSIAG